MAGLTKRCCSKCKAIKPCVDVFELKELSPISGKGILRIHCFDCHTIIEEHIFIKK
jgi:hypothetical protein